MTHKSSDTAAFSVAAVSPRAQKILILDFGSQYTQLIARRVRECGVYSAIYPYTASSHAITAFAADGIILSGGPETVTTQDSPSAPSIVFDLGIPVLGICYGMQTMASQLGGQVDNLHLRKEFGRAEIRLSPDSYLLQGIQDRRSEQGAGILDVWMSHGDNVTALPPNFQSVASSNDCPFAVIENRTRQLYGLQFHPEVTQTIQGMRILKRFLYDICGCKSFWTVSNMLTDHVERMRAQVGHEKVLLGLSGGVDSCVTAALLHKAIGDQLTCIFVDTGLLRANEAQSLAETFSQQSHLKMVHIEAKDRFFQALGKVTDPEQKRKIIGHLFVEIFKEVAEQQHSIQWLAQGTIYPDVVESAATCNQKAQVIKSHHNVGGLPENMPFKLLEPLRDLFKDEVRKLGLALGLPYETVYRHPFPGPGLAVRILGEVKAQYVHILQKADKIFIDALKKQKLYQHVSQAFAVFLPIKSVGVAGDMRTYGYVIALRAVTTVDFMTAQATKLPYAFLQAVGRTILNTIPEVARVVYDLSDKPPATIEWE